MRGSPTRRHASALAIGAVLAVLASAGCTSAPEEAATTPAPVVTSATPSASTGAGPEQTAEPTPTADPRETGPEELAIEIEIADGQVSPNGKKLNVEVGRPIALYVTSDSDDEVHAHTSDDGFNLKVTAGAKVRGEFTLTSPGRYEVESHHLGKTIVILNAR